MYGERIKGLRARKAITQTALAAAIGTAQSTLAMWELEKSQPNIDSLILLSDFFDVSVDYLIGRAAVSQRTPVNDIELALDPKSRGEYLEIITKIGYAFISSARSNYIAPAPTYEALKLLADGITEFFGNEYWEFQASNISTASQAVEDLSRDMIPHIIEEFQNDVLSPLQSLFTRSFLKGLEPLLDEAQKQRDYDDAEAQYREDEAMDRRPPNGND